MLSLVRGLPGSGKTTFAKKNFQCLHLEADMYHIVNGEYKWSGDRVKQAHAWCKQVCSDALAKGMDVVVSNTFTRLWEMQDYLDIAKAFGYDVKIYTCKGYYGNVHGVPEDVVHKMRDRWEDYKGEEEV